MREIFCQNQKLFIKPGQKTSIILYATTARKIHVEMVSTLFFLNGRLSHSACNVLAVCPSYEPQF